MLITTRVQDGVPRLKASKQQLVLVVTLSTLFFMPLQPRVE